MRWLDDGNHYCPVSGTPLQHSSLVLNKTLEWKIDAWIKEQGGERPRGESAICNDSTPPQRFHCPLSQNVMQDPVSTGEGVNFEPGVILEWLAVNDNCPVTGNPLTPADVVSNENLKREIEQWYSVTNNRAGGDTTVKGNNIVIIKNLRPVMSMDRKRRRSSSASTSSKATLKSLASMGSMSSGCGSNLTCLSSMLRALPPISDSSRTTWAEIPSQSSAFDQKLSKTSLISAIDDALEFSAANIGRYV
jgi:hypothetical protein